MFHSIPWKISYLTFYFYLWESSTLLLPSLSLPNYYLQDPNTKTAAGGEVYTMVEKKKKAKKGKEEKDDVAAMYSMPDKSKKNPEVSLFDIFL